MLSCHTSCVSKARPCHDLYSCVSKARPCHDLLTDVHNSVYRPLKIEILVNFLRSPVPQTTRLLIDDYMKRFHWVLLEINHRGDFPEIRLWAFWKICAVIYAEKRIFAIVFYTTRTLYVCDLLRFWLRLNYANSIDAKEIFRPFPER